MQPPTFVWRWVLLFGLQSAVLGDSCHCRDQSVARAAPTFEEFGTERAAAADGSPGIAYVNGEVHLYPWVVNSHVCMLIVWVVVLVVVVFQP